MGSSGKSLYRLMQLTDRGVLPAGASICDLGATEFSPGNEGFIKEFLNYYARRTPKADASTNALERACKAQFLGDILVLAGFEYMALDIFQAPRTVLFDLNAHEPGPDLVGKFDLVLNFGTTEHVFNQYMAFKTIHILTKPNGVMYHDLPMEGYIRHGLFRYDPLIFECLASANRYKILESLASCGEPHPTPPHIGLIGYPDQIRDVGLEAILQKQVDAAFRVPLETSTSLSVDPDFFGIADSGAVRLGGNVQIIYAPEPDPLTFSGLTRLWFERLVAAMGRRLRLQPR